MTKWTIEHVKTLISLYKGYNDHMNEKDICKDKLEEALQGLKSRKPKTLEIFSLLTEVILQLSELEGASSHLEQLIEKLQVGLAEVKRQQAAQQQLF
jgi:hypothetical protein